VFGERAGHVFLSTVIAPINSVVIHHPYFTIVVSPILASLLQIFDGSLDVLKFLQTRLKVAWLSVRGVLLPVSAAEKSATVF
jgi:hypothetical protein